ncbi:MAG: hypothetical protein GX256_02780 [Fretibacterium sp.]|nr:hypothetical protein [Fretibacterium sp.]
MNIRTKVWHSRKNLASWKSLLCLLFAFSIMAMGSPAHGAVGGELPLWWWNYDYGYQLRDVSDIRGGQTSDHSIARAQWFATVYERWLWRWRYPEDTEVLSFQMTQGGQAPSVPVVTSADLVTGFDHVYLEDPRHHYPPYFRDEWFDPIESMYLVIPSGRGELHFLFGNDVGRRTAWREGPYGPYMPPLLTIDATEDIKVTVPDYSTHSYPKGSELISPDRYLDLTFRFQAEDPQNYGSSLGYLTFRQSTSYDKSDLGYRESIKIPLVVANVFDGLASEPGNELYFDMTVFGTVWSEDLKDWVTDMDNPITRRRFRWGVGENLTQDFGTFFMIHPDSGKTPVYKLRTRVTNRTGTRYRVQRYDNLGTVSSQDLLPLYWTYDVPPDLYKTLPGRFYLDKQSQIAPGLVTHYESELDTQYSANEMLQLYPFASPEKPHDLRLTYRRIGGMTSLGSVSSFGWTVQGFHMTFADIAKNAENTEEELKLYLSGLPVMSQGFGFSGVSTSYIKADAINAFEINTSVPGGLVSADEPVSEDVASVPAKVAVLPLQIRLRIPRLELGKELWAELEQTDDPLSAFMRSKTVWVRSPQAVELDMNLLTSLSSRSVDVRDCVRAFVYNDVLYLDFIALLADAKSRREGKTAFLEVFRDDKVPYILLGDGKTDGFWNLSFYVADTGPNPTVPIIPPAPPAPPAPTASSEGQTPTSGGGGGCDGGFPSVALLIALAGVFPRLRGRR